MSHRIIDPIITLIFLGIKLEHCTWLNIFLIKMNCKSFAVIYYVDNITKFKNLWK